MHIGHKPLSPFIREHTEIGTHKAVSVLSMEQLGREFPDGLDAYIQIALGNGHRIHVCNEPEAVMGSGSVHVYDFRHLKNILDSNATVLTENGWPGEPDEFVKKLAQEWVEDWHPFAPVNPVISVIRAAFGNSAEFIEQVERLRQSPEYVARYLKLYGDPFGE